MPQWQVLLNIYIIIFLSHPSKSDLESEKRVYSGTGPLNMCSPNVLLPGNPAMHSHWTEMGITGQVGAIVSH